MERLGERKRKLFALSVFISWGLVSVGILGPLDSGHVYIFTYQIFFWETTTFNNPETFGIKSLIFKIILTKKDLFFPFE